MNESAVPAGWYSDPAGDQTNLRYWDGEKWTGAEYQQLPQQNFFHKYQKLGGFLLALVILCSCNVLIAIVADVTEFAQNIFTVQHYASRGAQGAAIGFGANLLFGTVQTFLELLLVIFILKKSKHVITVAAWIGISGLFGIIGLMVMTALDPMLSASAIIVSVTFLGVIGFLVVLVSALIVLYLCKSVRVRTYMGNDAYIAQTFWKFLTPPQPAVPDSVVP